MFSIIAHLLDMLLLIPACQPVSEIAGIFISSRSIASFAIETCSPVDISIAVSLLSGFFESSIASPINLSVVFPCADKITTTFLYSFLYPITLFATIFNFSLSATELPPNFKTTVFPVIYISPYKKYRE